MPPVNKFVPVRVSELAPSLVSEEAPPGLSMIRDAMMMLALAVLTTSSLSSPIVSVPGLVLPVPTLLIVQVPLPAVMRPLTWKRPMPGSVWLLLASVSRIVFTDIVVGANPVAVTRS